MKLRPLSVAMFCAAAPFAFISCAQPIGVGEISSPDNGSTGGSPAVGQGGSHTDGSGGSTGNGTGGSADHASGGIGMSSTGGTGSSTATGGSSTTGTGSGGSAAGGRPGSGGTGPVPGTGGAISTGGTTATGGRSGGTGGTTATGGRSGGTGGTTATGGVSGGAGAPGGHVGTGGGTGGTTTSSTAGGTIVPLYTDPTDSSWNAIVSAALAHPTVEVVAIVNPADGPGSSKRSDYTSGIAMLQAAKIKVIGYIATGYGSHSISSMETQIDTWKSFYPTVQGIFFDEQSNDPADVSHYQTLSQYAKSVGLSYTVGNPGTDVPTSYIGALDTMLVYETDGLPSVSSLQPWGAYPSSNFGIIPYKVSSMNATFVKQARQYVRYVYLTADDLPNPWDSLTPYFADLLAALE
jgi:Spherulation-specific family 4